MKRLIHFLYFVIACCDQASAQDGYADSIAKYQHDYIANHEVVKGDDRKFLQFFPVNETYRVHARFEKAKEVKWFKLATSGTLIKTFRVFGSVSFTINDTLVKADIYQSQHLLDDPAYQDYLVLMFTDKTTGSETYQSGRYLDLSLQDITDGSIILDFNKAYNPYCAYVHNKYNCPIPPKENNLNVSIAAGEKTFTRQ